MDDLLPLGRQVLALQPFSILVGAELTDFSPGWAELTIPITPQLIQQHGFVHGGVISYAADNAATGTVLIARATVIYSSKTQAVCRCDVFVVDEGKENLCAVSQGTIARIGKSSEAQA